MEVDKMVNIVVNMVKSRDLIFLFKNFRVEEISPMVEDRKPTVADRNTNMEGRNPTVEVTSNPEKNTINNQMKITCLHGLKVKVRHHINHLDLEPSVLGQETQLQAQSMTCLLFMV